MFQPEDDSRQALLVYDGTASAALLVHLVSEGLSQATKKRLTLEPVVIVVLTRTDRVAIEAARAQVDAFRAMLACPWHFVHLAAIFDTEQDENRFAEEEGDKRVHGLQHVSPPFPNCIVDLRVEWVLQLERWRDFLKAMSSATARHELVRLVKTQVIVQSALALKCHKVLSWSPESSNEITVVFLAWYTVTLKGG